MKRRIITGCSGFAEARENYYKNFECVEINATFYQMPRLAQARKWRKEAPDNFEFIIKAWQLITHPFGGPTYDRLFEKLPGNNLQNYGFFNPSPEVFGAWKRTKEFASVLGCSKVLFQTPSNFRPTGENMANMKAFFGRIGGGKNGLTFIWEPRGEWQEKEIKSACRESNLVHCADPTHNRTFSGAFNYFRLHGAYRDRETDDNCSYNTEELKNIMGMCGKKLNYVLFNHQSMLENALEFKKIAEAL